MMLVRGDNFLSGCDDYCYGLLDASSCELITRNKSFGFSKCIIFGFCDLSIPYPPPCEEEYYSKPKTDYEKSN